MNNTNHELIVLKLLLDCSLHKSTSGPCKPDMNFSKEILTKNGHPRIYRYRHLKAINQFY